jgi:hypothetical protein
VSVRVHGAETERPTLADWIELIELARAAPYAVEEIDALLTLYDCGQLPLEALKHSLRALTVRH